MRVIRPLCRALLLAAALPLTPSHVGGQALTSLLSLQVSYNTRKATLNPTGELKARLDSLDRDLAAATRAGRTSEARRLLAPVYDRFTEGFDPPDLRAARALLDRPLL